MRAKILNKTQRDAEFKRLFATIPIPRKVDRIRWTASKLLLAENTVRQYLMASPPRVPPELSLRVLRDEINKAKTTK